MNYLQITDEIILMFKAEPTAMIVWLDILLQIKKNESFIPRRKYIKNKFKLGNTKMNKVIKFLKDQGLAETFPLYKSGKMTGAQYKFYDLENTVQNPSPTTTPGPQAKTRVIEEKKPRTTLNGDISECLKNEHSEIIKSNKSSLKKFNNSNPDEYKKAFLNHFSGQNTFQTFDDSPSKKRHLSKIYYKYNPANLDAKNNQGAGVFLTINETDGRGRSKKNITRVRAVFADLDGAPLEPVLDYNPSMIIESSPGRYHSYWLTTGDTPLKEFKSLQQSIACKFGGDQVKDLSRVMRIPGYYHCKNSLFLSKILYTSKNKYSFDELKAMFLESSSLSYPTTKPFQIHGAHKGNRNTQLCKLIGAMKKRNKPDEIIKEQAYQFADACIPPLSKTQIVTTLRASNQWDNENEQM